MLPKSLSSKETKGKLESHIYTFARHLVTIQSLHMNCSVILVVLEITPPHVSNSFNTEVNKKIKLSGRALYNQLYQDLTENYSRRITRGG